ncbi:Uncharacterized protein TPAR_00375 [Tolypocladium paradoxum]|uniref:Uncharacterized protein n=1 Tax=Tolypocladium paradoxum TaxID=94208 RepID=A0A2S4LAG6_9HYPO|nr:Uncharacterized protein TPAR_00375 [Tolypocladium paradoxum]
MHLDSVRDMTTSSALSLPILTRGAHGARATGTFTTPPPPASEIKRDDMYDAQAIWEVLIPVSVFGWLTFGVICILCLNGRGKAGRWVPEWYVESGRTGRDKALVVAWWFAVVVMWPVILPLLGLRKLGMCVAKRVRKGRQGTTRRMLVDEKGTRMCEGGCSDSAVSAIRG